MMRRLSVKGMNMATLIDFLFGPFIQFGFMRHALLGACVLALGACPVGVFLMLRRMSLAGDALSHAILPGVALGFLTAGLSLVPMALGGLAAGLVVALLSGFVARATVLKEDASLAAFYLVSLALGVALISLRGNSVDLSHILFGTVLALDAKGLMLIGATASITILTLAVLWRALVLECLDPVFLKSVSRMGPATHAAFLVLAVLNLVGGFQALGTLLSVGLMMLPAAVARLWARRIETLCLLAMGVGLASCWLGLLASYHFNLAAGPSIVLAAGAIYLVSLLFSPRGLFTSQARRIRHKAA
jgi:zinc/manganese transport system permease protein